MEISSSKVDLHSDVCNLYPTTTHNFRRNSLMLSVQHILCSINDLSTIESQRQMEVCLVEISSRILFAI